MPMLNSDLTQRNQIIGTWWRYEMEIFSALLTLCVCVCVCEWVGWGGGGGNSPVTSEFLPRSFDVFFDLRLNKRLSKQSRRRLFHTPSRSLWCHRNKTVACHRHQRKPVHCRITHLHVPDLPSLVFISHLRIVHNTYDRVYNCHSGMSSIVTAK